MKKFIAVAAILSVMFLGAGTSQALMGVPDAVPGRDVLIPFFIVSMDGFGDENALIVLTEVGGLASAGVDRVHLTVWNRDSEHVHDEYITYTARDVWFTDGRKLLGKMSNFARESCEVDLDDDGVNDHWIGYVYFDNPRDGVEIVGGVPVYDPRRTNNLIAHAYQVSVSNGIVSGYVPPALENFIEPGFFPGHHPLMRGYDSVVIPGQDFDLRDVEAFNANALFTAKCRELAFDPVFLPATNLMLYPRFYLHDVLATNFLVIWTDEEPLFIPIDLPGQVTVNFYNQEELPLSAPLLIDRELNIIDITDIVPDGLFVDWPHAGWIDLDIIGPAFDARRYMLAYSIQIAPLGATTTLDVIFEAHRDATGWDLWP
jgi:hypothetical protein